MMNISIKRASTLEANVSQRTVGYSVIVSGVIVASFEEYEDAELFKEAVEKGGKGGKVKLKFKANLYFGTKLVNLKCFLRRAL